MVYAPGEQADLPMDLPWPGLNGPCPVDPQGSRGADHTGAWSFAASGPGLRRGWRKACGERVQEWLDHTGPEHIETCLVPRQALERLVGRIGSAAPRPTGPARTSAEQPSSRLRLRLAVASCHYPHGPLDSGPAQASLHRMADQADQAGLDLALFLGDQIYADATAGLVDATRRDERYERPHEQAQRASGMRRVLARLPSVMLADDHEFVDNWEPPSPETDSSLPVWRLRAEALRDGRWGYWKYERLRPQQRHQPRWDLADKAFSFAGLPIYLADTRTGRSARGSSVSARQAQILWAPGQFDALERWLLQHRDLPKVVATPSLLLPRRAEVAQDPASAPRSDAWDGYPASLDRLLDFMLREQILHTVFVSGDEHHALVCEVRLEPDRPQGAGAHPSAAPAPIEFSSVHSSALYAPFPFANGCPEDLSDEPFVTAGGTRVTLKTTPAPPGDGWARVSLTPGSGDGQLEVRFFKARDHSPDQTRSSPDG